MTDMNPDLLLYAALGLLAIVVVAYVVNQMKSKPAAEAPAKGRAYYEITARPSGVRSFLTVCFWLWGVFYGVNVLNGLVTAEGLSSLGVGTSAAMTMRIGFWLGGLVLFGVGALLAPVKQKIVLIEPSPEES